MILAPQFVKDSNSSLGLVKQLLDGFRVAFVGRVTAFYSDKQTVDIDPVVTEPTYTPDRNIDNIPWPSLSDVPVCTFGFGNWYLTMPIQIGSTVLVVCTDLELDSWYKRDQEVNISGVGYHSLNNAIAIAGINSSLKSLENYFTDGPEIRNRQGDTSIKISDKKVQVSLNSQTTLEMTDESVTLTVGGTEIATITVLFF